MRHQQQVAPLQLAPGASVPLPQLDEKDGPIVFRTPSTRTDFPHPLVHLNERSRAQQRKQSVVLQAYIPIKTVAQVEMLN
jgi:hypothetical protein